MNIDLILSGAKKNHVLAVFVLCIFGYCNTNAQCSGYTVEGPSPACTNTSPNYYVNGGNASGCTIVYVAGPGNTFNASASTVTWGDSPGTYEIDFSCPCGIASKQIVVQAATISGGTVTNPTQTICSGSTATPISVTGYTGVIGGWEIKTPTESSWTYLATASNPLPSSFISNTEVHQYRMIVQNNCGQSTRSPIATVNVTTLAAPPIPANSDITTSCGQIIPISIGTNYPAGNTVKHYYYAWNGDLLSTQTATTPFTSTVYVSEYTPSAFASPKNFYLEAEVLGINGCPSIKSERKTISYTLNGSPSPPPGLQIYQGANQITAVNVCPGEAITLQQVNGTSNYKWYNSIGALISSASTLSNYLPTLEGTYYVEATWTGSCGVSTVLHGNFEVNLTTPDLSISSAGSSFCSTEPPTFTAIILPEGSSNISYQWDLTPETTGSGSNFTLPENLAAADYTVSCTVTATFSGTCQTPQTLSETKAIQIKQSPNMPVVSGATRFGPGLLTLTASELYPVPTYKWYAPAGVVIGPTYNTPQEVTSSQTNYITVTATSDNGCEGHGRQVDISILDLPEITFDGPNYIPIQGSTILKTTETYLGYTWKNNLGVIVGGNPTLSVTVPGRYEVQVRIGGASTSAFVNVGDNLGNQNMNYIVETDVQKEGIVSEGQIHLLPIGDRRQNVQYFDGLGRPTQTVITQGSPNAHHDIIQPIVYDEWGREAVKYLPYVDEDNGRYKTDFKPKEDPDYTTVSSPQYQFYQNTSEIASDSDPYAQTIFDSSPLNRVLKEGAPGTTWQPNPDATILADHSIKKSYRSNVADDVLLLRHDPSTGLFSVSPSDQYYPANQLFVTITKDEHNNDVIQYINKSEQTILKRVKASETEWADTYYIFDDSGNLVVVIPPEASRILIQP